MRHSYLARIGAACLSILAIAALQAGLGTVGCTHLTSGGGSNGAGGASGSGGGGSGSSSGRPTGTPYTPPADTAVAAGSPPPSATKMACTAASYSDPWTPGYSLDSSIPAKVSALVNSMSIAELAQQMRGTDNGGLSNTADIFRTMDNTNKGIAGFRFRDGPRGVCLAAQLPMGSDGYSTAFPVAEARAASFDLALEAQVGKAIGDETLASGNTMILAPVLNILRNPAWGRAQETYGEDSFVLGRFGSAFTAGAQTFVPACAKHYAANNIENNRGGDNSQMADEQTLRESYARHFGVVIEDAGVSCIMASYNLVNGTKATINKHLLTDILRSDFGFQGFVLSDWWAMPPGTVDATTDALQANAIAGVNAGLDMELPWSYNYQQLEAVTGAASPIKQNQLQTAATRIITQKYRFNVQQVGGAGSGAASTGYHSGGLQMPTTKLSAKGSIDNNMAHVALARKAALEGMVLLKNEKILPIDKTKVKTIAVLGAKVPYVVNTIEGGGTINFATDVRLGDLGSSRVYADPAKSTGPLAGIQAAAGNTVMVTTGTDATAAATADFIVVVAGLTPGDEGEEYTGAGDRTSFKPGMSPYLLDDKNGNNVQNDLIAAAAALNKPMVVVLEGGAIIDMPWLSQVPAVVMAWYPGMDGGTALGQLLFGTANFSGKLPMTWPKVWTDEPALATGTSTTMDYFVGYKYFDNKAITPLFAFGSGLSYTTFKYVPGSLVIPCSTVTPDGVVGVQLDVTNTGAVAGDEVAFLFVSYPNSAIRRPAKELKGFHRVSLGPGETKRITIPLRVADLKAWDNAKSAWVPPSGTVQVMVGPSSDNLPLKDTFTIQ
jgi:beta-glucosidase